MEQRRELWEKVKIFDKIGMVEIGCPNPLIGHSTFVRFAFGRVNKGNSRALFIFDHRRETLQAAQNLDRAYNYPQREQYRRELVKAINKPARIIIMEKRNGDKNRQYINLFQTDRKPETVLCEESRPSVSIDGPHILWQWSLPPAGYDRPQYRRIVLVKKY